MNYVLTLEGDWNRDFRVLDYSREKLATLYENDLDEDGTGKASSSPEISSIT